MAKPSADTKIQVIDMHDVEYNKISYRDAKLLMETGNATIVALEPLIIKLTKDLPTADAIRIKKPTPQGQPSSIILKGESEPLNLMAKLSKDLKAASVTLTNREARYLTDTYYQFQDNRMRDDGRVRSMEKDSEPHEILSFFGMQAALMEQQIQRALDSYSLSTPVGQWAREVCGIGPIIAAGLIATIDIEKAPTASHIWRYAGLDPTVKWKAATETEAWVRARMKEGRELDQSLVYLAALEWGRNAESLMHMATTDHLTGDPQKLTIKSLANSMARRPWSGLLKVLCWKAGESFVKVKSNENDVYGKLYEQRKAWETLKNEKGDYAEQASQILTTKNFGDNDARKAYEAGKLPKGHIHARAKRWAVKLFLAHLHDVMYRARYNTAPPAPYPIAHQGHAHMIEVPYLNEFLQRQQRAA